MPASVTRRKAVVHRRGPIRARQGPALIVRNRHEGEGRPRVIDTRQVADVEPAMQRRDRTRCVWREHGEMQKVRVKVQHVELACARKHFVQHRKMGGDIGFARRIVQSKRALATRVQRSARARISAREQRHFVTEVDQRVGKVRDDPLGAAVQARRHRLVQRRDLRNAQSAFGRDLARDLLRRARLQTLHNTAS